jgi:RNA polymerase sigma-70 factor (ECF subfamily)
MAVDSLDHWLGRWILEHGDPLVRFVGTYTHDYHAAQDIAQEAFLRLYREHLRHPTKTLHAGWLYTVARRLAIDYHRRQRPAAWDILPYNTEVALSDDRSVDVERILDSLRALDRELLLLFYYQEWSIARLAEHYAISVHTVKSRLHRARERFRRHWMKEGETDHGA